MFRTDTGRNCLSLCINPILDETFVAMFLICLSKVRYLSVLIPSNLVHEHCVKSCSSSLILILEMFKVFCLVVIHMKLDFEELTTSHYIIIISLKVFIFVCWFPLVSHL